MIISYSISIGHFASTGFSVSASFIVFLLSASFLFPVVLDTTKFFYIRKLVIGTNNITATKILKITV